MIDSQEERQRVMRAVRGDPDALAELQHRYGPAVHAVLLANGPPAQANDLTAGVFDAAAKRISSLEEISAVGPWFLDLARERAARAPGGDGATGDLHRILSVMSVPDREMFLMSLAEGMREEEIARATGKSPVDVSAALSRALEKLGPETGRLESMLRALRWTPPARQAADRRSLPALLPVVLLLLSAAALVAFFVLRTKEVSGSRIHWTAGKSGTEAFKPGQVVETQAGERARIAVGSVGHVEVEPYAALSLEKETASEIVLALTKGILHADVDAPPRGFVVTAAGVDASALGACTFTVEYSAAGGGELDVTRGAVSLVADGKSGAWVPAGARCLFGAKTGPGVPYFLDAPTELHGVDATSPDVLSAPLSATRAKDTLTLFHLLPLVDEGTREVIVLKLAELAPLPEGVSPEQVTALDAKVLASYEATLKPLWK